MIVYPHLEYESLQTRCIDDIKRFVKELQTKKSYKNTNYEEVDYILVNPTENSTIEELQHNLEPLMTIFRDNLSGEDYVKKISHIDNKKIQNKLWVCRTYLFYQLLIYASAICTHEVLYNAICIPYYEKCGYMATNKEIFMFRTDIITILQFINLGIFGSLSPTSDIDLGLDVNYDKCKLKGPPLAYLVACIESMFFIFTNKSSLRWDIEIYGNLLTLPNPKYNPDPSLSNDPTNNPDYFYLDTSHFEINDFKQILQPVIAGMLRNIILGYKDHHVSLDINKKTLDTSSRTLLSLLTDNEVAYGADTINQLTMLIKTTPELRSIFEDKPMFTSAQKDALDYITLADIDEKQSLLVYYQKFNEAEQVQINVLKKIGNNVTKLEVSDIVSILVAWEKAGLCKMENYISSPSIIHIVQLLQAQKNSLNKYKTTTPGIYCKGKIIQLEPFCIIGKYGAIVSILEQIGYMIRFYNTYCIPSNHYNITTCDKKIKKYKDRLISGDQLLHSTLINANHGGRYRKHRNHKTILHKKHRSHKKTRKHRKYRN